MNPKHWYF